MRLELRHKVSIAISALVVGTTILVGTIANVAVTQAVEGKIQSDLLAGRQVFEAFQHLRFQQLLTSARMVAEIPHLKAVVTTPDIDHATVLDSAQAIRQLVNSDLFIICDSEGRVLASVTEPSRHGDDMAGNPAFASALRGESFQGVWTTEAGIYQVVAVPFLFGNEVVGALLTGFVIDRGMVEMMEKMTNSHVALMSATRTVASPSASNVFKRLAEAMPQVGGGSVRTFTEILDGERYLMLTEPFGTAQASYFLARSLDQELGFYHRLQRRLLGVTIGVLLSALLLGLFFSVKITQPIQALVKGTQQVASGDLTSRIPIASTNEMGQLAGAFNHMTEALERREAQLRQADQMKTEILDVLSHELRTPLAAIQEGASLLRERSDALSTSDREDVLKTAGDNMERLERLFDKVSLVTEIVTGQFTCTPTPVEIEAVLYVLSERWQEAAQAKRLTLQLEQRPGRLQCWADGKWIGRALDELVANAIQASPPGGRVGLMYARSVEAIEIAIQDMGTGIPREELPTLFERFRWVGDTSRRKTGGFGLGLFIAKSLVEAQGGTLTVDSAVGQGTTMKITLTAL